MRDAWNVLDFFIVVTGLISLNPSSTNNGVNLSGLRALRVLRPLRTINKIEGLKLLVNALLSALPLLRDTIIILMFFFFIYAIAGLQLFQGALKRRCVNIGMGYLDPSGTLCSSDSQCNEGFVCGKSNLNNNNHYPSYGAENFDNILYSLLNVFTGVTLEGWTYIMMDLERTYNIISIPYFMSLSFIGAFFLLNLTLAVINSKFNEAHKKQEEDKKRKKALKNKLLQVKQRSHLETEEKPTFRQYLIAKKAAKQMIKFLRKRQGKGKNGSLEVINYMSQSFDMSNNNIIQQDHTFSQNSTTINHTLLPKSMTFEETKSENQKWSQNEEKTQKILNLKKALVIGRQNSFRSNKDEQLEVVDEQRNETIQEEEEFEEELQSFGENTLAQVALSNFFYFLYIELVESQIGKYKAQSNTKSKLLKMNGNWGQISSQVIGALPESFNVFNPNNYVEAFQNENILEQKVVKYVQDNPQAILLSKEDEQLNDDLDFSFIHEINFKNSLDKSISKDNEDNEIVHSIISSESSANIEPVKPSPIQIKKAQKIKTNFYLNKQEEQQLRRFSTISPKIILKTKQQNESDKNLKIRRAETHQNEQTNEGNKEKIKKQVTLSTSSPKKIDESFSNGSTSKGLPSSTKRILQSIGQLYNQFSSSTNGKLSEYIDQRNQKVKIVSHQDYESTSQNEVFENRFRVNHDQDSHQFIHQKPLSASQDDSMTHPKVKEDIDYQHQLSFIQSSFKPYQQKVLFECQRLQDDHNYSNNSEEDRKNKQPYETITGIAFAHSLTQLPTKQITRRSDTIVTSTLAMSTIEKSKKGKAFKAFALMDDEEREAFKDRKEQLRASQMTGIFHQVGKSKKLYKKYQTSLNSRRQFKEKDSIYMIKKAKTTLFHIEQPKPAKKKKDKILTAQKKLSLHDAKKIIEGKYYQSDEEGDDNLNEEGKQGNNKEDEIIGAQKRNRQALQRSKFQDKTLLELDKVINIDDIPDELKKELQLPEGIGSHMIDYDQIRKMDATIKKKRPYWSGQDVLQAQIDQDQAEWIIGQLNSVRVWPKGLHGYVKRLRCVFRKIVRNGFFENFMISLVIANTVVLSLDRYGIPATQELITNKLNSVFTYFFISELGMKLIAFGVVSYLRDKMNYIDGTVVILSIVELAFLSGGSGKSSLSAFRSIRIFRTFRVLRVARMLKGMRSMQVIMGVIGRSIVSFCYISILLFLFVFIYALLGMQIFGNQWNFDDIGLPRENYDTFNTAFMTSFQLMTMERWPHVLYYGLKSKVNKGLTIIYFISWIVIGNYILVKLFLAILIDAFLEEGEQEEKEEMELVKKDQANQKGIKVKGTKRIGRLRKSIIKLAQGSMKEDEEEDIEDMDDEQIMNIFREQGMTKERTLEQQYESLFKSIDCKNSFYLFSKKNKLRVICYQVLKHRYFERTILCAIVLSSLKLAFDTYIIRYPDTSQIKIASSKIDIAFSLIFILEAVIKTMSMGVIQDKGSYLRDTWNILDFFIVICSLIDLIFTNIHLPFIKVLRLLRTLRPLRFISHNVGLKMIVIALFESIGPIANVLIVIFLIWLMFAILGVDLWAGKMFQCSILPYLHITKAECLKAQGSWIEYVQNFDSVPQAMLTLFSVSTLENWPDVQFATKDTAGVNEGPILNNCSICPYFFVAFIMIGTYFFLNFFIGVLFLNYSKAKNQENRGLSNQHLCWLDIQKMIIVAGPDFESLHVPRQKWRLLVYKIVTKNKFDFIIMGCIVLNMIQMALTYEGASTEYVNILDKVNIFFTLVFTVECILKIIAYDKNYWKPAWHKFDFFVVVTSLLDILIDNIQTNPNNKISFLRMGPQLARVLRVLRVSRILRLLNKYQGLQALIQTISFSLPELLNVFGLLLLVLFMFSVLGVFFFNDIIGSNIMGKSYIDDKMNFANVGNAMMILFRSATGEDWNYIMYSCMQEQEGGNCYSGGTCGSQYSFIFYLTFIILFRYVFSNLFVLVVLQQFDKYYLPKDNIIGQFKNELQTFKDSWKAFTQQRYQCVKINENQLLEFFQKLKEPLGMPGIRMSELKRVLLKMGIKSEDGYIFFNELLYRCMKRVYGKLKLNKAMQVAELKTQYKIFSITMATQKKGKYMKNQEIFSKMLGKTKSVNPFLTVMFLKMSFKSWLNITKKIKVNAQRRLSKRQSMLKVASSVSNNVNDFDWGVEGGDLVYVDQFEEEIVYLSCESESEVDDSLSSSSEEESSNQEYSVMDKIKDIEQPMTERLHYNSHLNDATNEVPTQRIINDEFLFKPNVSPIKDRKTRRISKQEEKSPEKL